MTTPRIEAFLAERRPESPCLVVDLALVRDAYLAYAAAFPDTEIFYAVKANPAPEILASLLELGASFDCASVGEIELALTAGAPAERLSFGNTIKKERDVARAAELGVAQFALDAEAELDKIARAAPGARVTARILCSSAGAEWPLSRKFGSDAPTAITLLAAAAERGLVPEGVSFHVGSQQRDTNAWEAAIDDAARVFEALDARGIELARLNLGGGFPARYLRETAPAARYAEDILGAVRRRFGNRAPATAIEPGRGLVGEAGAIQAEVVLVSRKSAEDAQRWVFLDIGKFGGLAETMDEAIRYPIQTPRDGERTGPCVLAGPTCDSADVLYERAPYDLPLSLGVGDRVLIGSAGAYTASYSSVGFNGLPPLPTYVV